MIRQSVAGPHEPATSEPTSNTSAVTAGQIKTLLGVALNDDVATVDSVRDVINRSSLRWQAGFTGVRTWALGEDGSPIDYRAHVDSTAAERASTAPGTNGSIWIITELSGDPVAAYTSARDS